MSFLRLKGFENIKITGPPQSQTPRTSNQRATESHSKIVHQDPTTRKGRQKRALSGARKFPAKIKASGKGNDGLHFLERTDPNFEQDLAESVNHVAYVATALNRAIERATLPTNIADVELRQLDTVCRETVTTRRSHSDNGDIEIVWTVRRGDNTAVENRAILEVKQRKTPKFDDFKQFPYPSLLTDEKRLFDKIRKRGDTVGYLVTNYNKQIMLFVSHDNVEKHHTTRTARDRFKNRMRTYVNVPVEHFVEGIDQCAAALLNHITSFKPRNESEQSAVHQQISRERVVVLENELKIAERKCVRLRRELEKEKQQLAAPTPQVQKKRNHLQLGS